MADANNSLNHNIGINIKAPQKPVPQQTNFAKEAVKNLWQPLFNFIEKNQAVFTGDISSEIEKYNLMSYNVGAALRAGQTTGRNFNELI